MKQIIAFLVFWISFLSCQSEEINIYTQHVKEISKNKDGWNLVWSEEFEQESNIPNTKSWSLAAKEASPWNRYMSESYDQAYVKDGKLYLIAEKKDGEYKTGGVWTMDKVGFKYGKLEVCAKFTSFQGGWAAIWLMPQERQYPSVNNSYPGEIDIMEQVSMDKIAQHSVHTHYTLDLGYDKNPPRNGYGEYRDGEFNIYGIEWTAEKIIFTVNGEETFSYPNLHLPNESLMQQWPFDVPYYLILNYSVRTHGRDRLTTEDYLHTWRWNMSGIMRKKIKEMTMMRRKNLPITSFRTETSRRILQRISNPVSSVPTKPIKVEFLIILTDGSAGRTLQVVI